MYKLMLSLIAIWAMSFISSGQTFDVNWGPEYKVGGRLLAYQYILGADGKHFYVVSDPRGKAKLLKFDYTATMVSEEPLDVNVGKTKAQARDIIRTSSGTYLTYVARNKKTGIVNFFYTQLKNGQLNSELTEFYTLPYSHAFGSSMSFMFWGGAGKDATESADYVMSPNQKYIAIVSSEVASGKQENIKVAVFDDRLKPVWEKSYSIPIAEKHISLEQFVVNDNGDVILSAREYLSKEDRKKGTPKYKYLVYQLTREKSDKHVVELDGDRVPWDTGIFPSAGNGIYIGGFYTGTTTSRGSADGVFFVSLVGGKTTMKTYPFTAEFLDGLQSRKQERKGEGITSFYIDNMVRFSDGSFSFIAEKTYITTHTVTTSNGKTTTTTTYIVYHSDEIVIPRFDADGELLGLNKVEKTFASRSPHITSYSFFFNKDRIALVYSDFKTREERKDLGKGRTIYTDVAYIKGEEDVEIKNLFTGKDTDMYYVPGQCLDLGNGTHVVRVVKRKNYMYGIVNPF